MREFISLGHIFGHNLKFNFLYYGVFNRQFYLSTTIYGKYLNLNDAMIFL